MKGDFQARFRGKVRVKFLCLTRLAATLIRQDQMMKKLILAIIILFISTNSFCQKQKLLHIGELIIDQSYLNSLGIGDTLILDFPKKKAVGTIRIDDNKTLYEWTNCNGIPTKKKKNKFNWCKIGLWQIDEKEVLFTLTSKIIKFSYLPVDNKTGLQVLIVTEIKSSSS